VNNNNTWEGASLLLVHNLKLCCHCCCCCWICTLQRIQKSSKQIMNLIIQSGVCVAHCCMSMYIIRIEAWLGYLRFLNFKLCGNPFLICLCVSSEKKIGESLKRTRSQTKRWTNQERTNWFLKYLISVPNYERVFYWDILYLYPCWCTICTLYKLKLWLLLFRGQSDSVE